jgi:hypothetical protein
MHPLAEKYGGTKPPKTPGASAIKRHVSGVDAPKKKNA